MYLYSLTKIVSFGLGQKQQQLNESEAAITSVFLHYILYFMTCLCMRQRRGRGGCLIFVKHLLDCAGVCTCEGAFVCGYADRVLEDRLLPR